MNRPGTPDSVFSTGVSQPTATTAQRRVIPVLVSKVSSFRLVRPTWPSGAGDFHPRALTEPCVIVSNHTARGILQRLPPSAMIGRFLPLPVDQVDHSADAPAPSLHGHYSASSLLRAGPSLVGVSVLSASRVFRLYLFPSHRRTGSQVPYWSLNQSHATSTPDTASPVIRFPRCSSRG
jgi:hypothetical protein